MWRSEMKYDRMSTITKRASRREIGRQSPVSLSKTFTLLYDLDGNQTLVKTSTGVWSVTYNGENRPVSWTCGATNIVMKFDSMGRRVEYVEMVSGVTNTHHRFVYDGYLCIKRLNAANNSVVTMPRAHSPAGRRRAPTRSCSRHACRRGCTARTSGG